MEKLKIVFLGTPAFSVPTLEALHLSPDIELSIVVSMPDRPAGRGQQLHSPEVITYAKKHKIEFAQSENINKDQKLIQRIQDINPDVVIVLAFAQFLNSTWLKMAKLGVFNIHTSLLPKYRGAAPIQAAILNGDSVTGVSIQKMVKKMDAGDIVYSLEVPVPLNSTSQDLSNLLQMKAAQACIEFVKLLKQDALKFEPQDESLVSYASIIKKDDGLVDFNTETAQEIFRKHLAYFPWPGTFFFVDGKRIKILKLEIAPHDSLVNQINVHDSISIGCKQGSIILLEAQPEGKRVLNTTEFRQWLKSQNSLCITRSK